MLYLVEDDSALPAQYGALAALLADALRATLWPLRATFDETRFPDAVQHVTRDRGLAPSGLIWAERLGVMPAPDPAGADGSGGRAGTETTGTETTGTETTGALLAAARMRDVVVPWHPRIMDDGASADAWRMLAATHGVPLRHCRVLYAADDDARLAGRPAAGNVMAGVARIIDGATGRDLPMLGICRQDRFGRWSSIPARSAGARGAPHTVSHAARTTACAAPATPACLRLALIGSEANQREVYPATLAALGDALDDARVDGAAVEVLFIAPETLRMPGAAAALAGCDGILLPGGADMRAVPGQMAAARHGWLSGTPVVGLCLGMQTMATAVLQIALGAEDVGLAEVDAHVRVPSFVPMTREPLSPALPSSPLHRVGAHRMRVVGGSHLETILDGRHGLRYNHRYRFNPALHAALTANGVSVAARDETGAIVDAIEARGHPFFIGMQGHPEQSSAPGRPHPLLRAFVDAACVAAASRRR